MRNILVTGGAGFIGSNFIHYILSENKKINVFNIDKLTYASDISNLDRLPDPSRHKLIQLDICDFPKMEVAFQDLDIDTVVHFAAETHVDRSIEKPAEFINTNVLGTYNLLECCKRMRKKGKDIRFHHISTDEVFGSLETLRGFFKETTPYAPRSPYSASKASSDHLVRAYGTTFGLPYTITNCSNNYGIFQHTEKLIPTIILNAVRGNSIPIYGKGVNIRDWIHVADHCRAIYKVLQDGEIGETYLVGSNNERTNLEIANMICEILDKIKPLPFKRSYTNQIDFDDDRPGHDFRYAIESEKIKKKLDWKPTVDFEVGLYTTTKWYLKKYLLD